MNKEEQQIADTEIKEELDFTILNADKTVLLESDNGAIAAGCTEDCRSFFSCCNATCNCAIYG